MTRIREILLTQYIGAIVIALLLVNAFGNFIQLCMLPIVFQVSVHFRSHSVFGSVNEPQFDWQGFLSVAVRVVLYVAATYALVAWLYLQREPVEEPEVAEGPEEPDEGRD